MVAVDRTRDLGTMHFPDIQENVDAINASRWAGRIVRADRPSDRHLPWPAKHSRAVS